MTVLIASDHGGFREKEAIEKALAADGHNVVDFGADTLDPNDDYTAILPPLAARLAAAPSAAYAIVLGRSGQGEAMLMNRYAGVRCALYYGGPTDILTIARAHNGANALSLGGDRLTEEEAVAAVRAFLAAPDATEERHLARIRALG